MSQARRNKKTPSRTVIAFSASYQRGPLLARGLGLEHLNELMVRLARPLVSSGLSVAYAGGWKQAEDNFTLLLLRLISSEQDDTSDDPELNPDAARTIAPLINHLAWPHYLEVTDRIEAEWINSARIQRVTQELAELSDICPDAEASYGSDRALFNSAVTLSVMRKLQIDGMNFEIIPGVSEGIPPLAARILIGGKTSGFSGFAPGVFEEALLMLEAKRPLFVLGGFGGATGELGELLLGTGAPDISVERFERETPALTRLLSLVSNRPMPIAMQGWGTARIVAGLHAAAAGAKSLPEGARLAFLNTGLIESETIELMTTLDIDRAVQLVMKGLSQPPLMLGFR